MEIMTHPRDKSSLVGILLESKWVELPTTSGNGGKCGRSLT